MESLNLKCEVNHCLSLSRFQVNHENQSKLFCEVHTTDAFQFESPKMLDNESIADLQYKLCFIRNNIKKIKENYIDMSEKIIERVACLTRERLDFLVKVEKNIDIIKKFMQRSKTLFRKIIQSIEENALNQSFLNFNLQKILMSLNSLFCTEYLEEKLNVESFQSIFIKKPQSPLTLKMIENIGIETSTKKDIKAYDLLDYRFFSTLTSVEQKVKLLMNLPLPNKKPLQKPNIFTVLPTIEALQIIQSKNQIITLHKDHYLCSWSLKTLTFKSGDLKLFNNTENYKIISIFSLNDENLLLIFNQAIIRVNLKSFKIRGTNFNISSPIQHSLLQSNRFLIITNFLGKLQVFDLETFDFKPFNRENKWIDIHASHLQGPITCIVGVEDWVVAGGRDGNIKIWRVGEEKVKNFSAHPVEVRAVSLSMNKYFIASAGEDKKITLWTQTSDSFKCVWSKKFTDRTVLNLTFNFDSSKLLMKTQSQIVYFDLVNGEKSEVRYYEYAKIVGDFPGVVEIIDGFNK